MKKKIGRKNRFLAITLLFGLLSGCLPQQEPPKPPKPPEPSPPQGRDSIVIATMAEPPSLSPTEHHVAAGVNINVLTYNTLFKTDMNLEPIPSLVESYTMLDDTTWEFTLREGVKFHNGEVLDAQDVKASIERAKSSPQVSQYNKSILSVEAPDPRTVRIKTSGPDALLLSNLACHGNAILPKTLIDAGHDFGAQPIGTGPYRLTGWEKGRSLEFEGFADYFEGAPKIGHMTWKIVPEGAARAAMLEKGEVDFIIEVDAMDAVRIQENPELELIAYSATDEISLVLNNEVPGLDNEAFRHAINSAINKQALIDTARKGMATVALSQMPMNFEGATEENADAYDVERAREWLEQSGVDPGSFVLSILCADEEKRRVGLAVQEDLKEIGISCQLESVDLASYLAAIAEGNYMAAIGSYSADDLLSYVSGAFHSDSIGHSNWSRLQKAQVDALIEEARITVDPDERRKILEELSALVNRLCPQVPLYQPIAIRAFDARLKGVEISDGGTIFWNNVCWSE